jgi:hypothetical protein
MVNFNFFFKKILKITEKFQLYQRVLLFGHFLTIKRFLQFRLEIFWSKKSSKFDKLRQVALKQIFDLFKVRTKNFLHLTNTQQKFVFRKKSILE